MNYCILDTSVILQRFQPTNKKAQEFIDSLYQNKKIELYLPYICFSEVIQQFYNVHRKSQNTATPITVSERTILINRLKQDIKNDKLALFPTENSIFARTEEIYNKSFLIPPLKFGDPIDMADMIVIATSLEFKSILKQNEEVYIFSSDQHLLSVAISLGIKSFDPKTTPIKLLPPCFDRRSFTRNNISLKVVCKNCETSDVYGSTNLVDICEFGLCLEQPQRNIIKGERINFSIPSFSNLKESTTRNGVVAWNSATKLGIELEEPLQFN